LIGGEMTNFKFTGIIADEVEEGVKTLVVEFRELDGIVLTAETFEELEDISRDYLSEAMNVQGQEFDIEFVRSDALKIAQ
jgi:hypothetical protein